MLGVGWGKEIIREYGKVIYTLLYLKWITVQDQSVSHGVSVCVLSFCVCLTLSVLMDWSILKPLEKRMVPDLQIRKMKSERRDVPLRPPHKV